MFGQILEHGLDGEATDLDLLDNPFPRRLGIDD